MRARTDDLTGLLNHGTFKDWLGRSVVARDPFGLVMIDLDEFKTVNDSLGHQAGDRLLREIADAILAAARETDAVFRYGGDEFVVILPRTDAEGLMAAAERILQAVESVGGTGSAWHAEGVRVGASIGTAFFPDDGETPEDVLLAADRACFVAKRRGRGHVATASEGLAIASEFELSEPTPVDPPTTVGGLTGARRGAVTTNSRCASQSRPRGGMDRAPVTSTSAGIAIARSSGSRSSRASSWCSPAACRLPCRGRPIRRRRRRGPRRRPIPPPRRRPPPPTPTPAPTFVLYKVKAGDTLTSIAKEFKTDGALDRLLEPGALPVARPGVARSTRRTASRSAGRSRSCPGQAYVPPEDDGESGELYTPPPDDLDPEEPEDSPRRRVALTSARWRPASLAVRGSRRVSSADGRRSRFRAHASSSSGRSRPTPVIPSSPRASTALSVDAVARHGAAAIPLDASAADGGSRPPRSPRWTACC